MGSIVSMYSTGYELSARPKEEWFCHDAKSKDTDTDTDTDRHRDTKTETGI